ncbi:acyl carrier protein [Paenibacillus sp. OAS669]|uniref:acyl carrier protein n=1 Tax=Paenibacillus sp. OAS669 TaxID=2663821 RepID=UPI00178B9124|nr:acyl carrier protein [Paenibacillus sp. OAS669]MBE1445664.1 acyl carrier protein [Paenibacillus sp. OAS669]
MTVTDFIEKFEQEILMEEQGTVTLETQLDTLDGWDSVSIITLIAFFDQEFGLELNHDQISQFKKVSDIVEIIGHKLD